MFFQNGKQFTVLIATTVTMSVSNVCFAASCLTNNNLAKQQIDKCIKIENLLNHLKAFQQFADQNTLIPGTRFMGTPGYEASKKYVVKNLEQAGYRVSLQQVPVTLVYINKPRIFEQIHPTQYTFTDDIEYSALVGSGEGDITAKVQTVEDGCDRSQFKDFIKGNIALFPLTRDCERSTLIQNAENAGAKAAIFVNRSPGIYFIGLVPAENIPALIVSAHVGKMFNETMKTGIIPTVHIKFNARTMKTMSENIIAESKEGDPNHVVMVGAHLDSSVGNAGMNDNASAAASVLETALLLKDVKPNNKLRFAFWTGEEMRMLGSNYYVEHLSNSEKSKIALYLNYEILGAPNGARLIMGYKPGVTPKGSEKITARYVNYFKDQGLKYLVFDPSLGHAGERSDMLAFMQAGIPVGYLVSGADLEWNIMLKNLFKDLPNRKVGVSMHPCYHKLCDKLTLDENMKDPNFDFDLYLQLSKAAASVIYSYAMNLDG